MGVLKGLTVRAGKRVFTSPAMGVGNLLIFLTSPGLIALSSLHGRGKKNRDFLNHGQVFAAVVTNPNIKKRAGLISQPYSHNRMPFSNPLRKSLSPKLLPVTVWGRRTGRDRCKGGLEQQLQQVFALLTNVLIFHSSIHQLAYETFITRPLIGTSLTKK